ncbi:MAG: Trp biosynthesis-associated membrane protein [Propioniciclava sp.]
MTLAPRPLLFLFAAVGFAAAWAPWWQLTWTDALGTQTVDLTGAQGSSGLAQILPAAALGGVLSTLTLRCVGRRIIAAVLAMLCGSMFALGFDAWRPDPSALALTEPRAALATDPTATTGWAPVAYLICGALGVVAALWFAVRPGDRLPESGGSARGVADTVSPWKAMDEGEDPTSDEWDGDRS